MDLAITLTQTLLVTIKYDYFNVIFTQNVSAYLVSSEDQLSV